VYIVTAMLFPALAIAADAFARRWRWILPVMLAVFLGSIPANIRQGSRTAKQIARPEIVLRNNLLAIAASPYARQSPRDLHPAPIGAALLTMGWLVDAKQHGKLPSAGVVSATTRREVDVRLAFHQERGLGPTSSCQTLTSFSPLVLSLHKGDVLGISHRVVQISPLFVPPSLAHPPVLFFPSDGPRNVVLHATGPVVFSAVTKAWTWRLAMSRPNDYRRGPPMVCVQKEARPTRGSP
jgi:hypothetical protein